MKKILTFFLVTIFSMVLISCSSSEEQTNKVKPKGEPLSPGTAQVEAEVLSMSEEGKVISYELKINKVLGYGQSASPISENTNIAAKLSRYLTGTGKKPEVDKTYNMILAGPGKGEEAPQKTWEITKFE